MAFTVSVRILIADTDRTLTQIVTRRNTRTFQDHQLAGIAVASPAYAA